MISMKFLFKLIVLPIITILAIPAIFLALTYKSVVIPVEDFEGTTAMPLSQMINEEFDAFLTDNDSESTVGINIAQADANGLLKAQFLGINQSYLDENAPDDQRYYVIKEDFFGYQGSWVRFKDKTVEIESGLHVFVGGFTFKTRLLIAFEIEISTDEVVLKLDKLTVGNLPLAWTFSTVSWAAEQITGNSIKDLIDDQLGGIAEFDMTKREIRLNVDNLLEEAMSEDPQTLGLVRSLLAFIEENDLLDIGFADGEFVARFALGKTRDVTTPIVAIPVQDRILNDAQLQAILASRVNALVLTSIYSPNPFIELDAYTLNRVFEYFMRNTEFGAGIIHEAELIEGINLKALTPFVSMTSSTFVVNIPLIIEDAVDPSKSFRTVIIIDATPSVEGNDLLITLNTLVAGEVELSNEHISTLLSALGENDIIRDGAFVLENFDEQMNQAGMGIQSVEVVGGKLRLYISLNESIPFAEIQQAVQDVLDNIANNPNYPPELNNAINDVLSSLVDPEADPEEAVANLLEVLEGLSDEEQEQLLNDLLDEFQNTDLDFSEIFNLLP